MKQKYNPARAAMHSALTSALVFLFILFTYNIIIVVYFQYIKIIVVIKFISHLILILKI
jgi:hypothetical protein